MHRPSWTLAFMLGLVPCAQAGPSPTPPTVVAVPAAGALTDVRATLLARVARGEAPSFAVGAARGAQVLWEEGLGWADRERRTAATPTTRYAVASASKSITATGALALVSGGALRLDDPVPPRLGGVRLPASGDEIAAMRVSHLLAHTSGIPHLWWYEYPDRPTTVVGRERLLRADGIVVSPPGSRYLYSNLGYGALAQVVATTGGAPFQRVMERVLFRPLGLSRTTVDAWMGSPGTARGYDSDGRVIPYRYRLAPDGGAGFFSTVHDLLRYARFHLGANDGRLPAAVTIRSALEEGTVKDNYLRGWGVVRTSEETVLLSDGQMAGGTAVVALVPERYLAAVVLCNQTGGPTMEAALGILSSLAPGLDARFQQALAAIGTEATAPGSAPLGTFAGAITDGDARRTATLDFGEPPTCTTEGVHLPLRITGWERGAMEAVIAGLPAGEGRSRRLQLTLWWDGAGLRGVAQEGIDDDRPGSGVPHAIMLQPVP